MSMAADDMWRHVRKRRHRPPPSAETRAKISAAIKAAHAAGRIPKRNPVYEPPAEFRELYDILRKRFGPKDARRLIKDHAVVVARRAKSGT